MTLYDRLFAVLKASRPSHCMFGSLLFAIGMLDSHEIPESFHLRLCAGLQFFAFSIPLSIIFLGVNDVYDYETDRRNPRKLANGLEGSVLDPIYHKDVLNTAYCSTVLVLLSVSTNYHRDNMLATIVLLMLAWQYSAPPLRFKERPIFDSISNGCISFLAWFCGFSFSGLSISDIPPGKGTAFGLCVVGIHALVAVVDSKADTAAGQKTIVTALGERQAAIFAASCYAVGYAIADPTSVVKSHAWMGIAIMAVPCFKVNWAYRSFQAMVCFSGITGVFWLCSVLRNLEKY